MYFVFIYTQQFIYAIIYKQICRHTYKYIDISVFLYLHIFLYVYIYNVVYAYLSIFGPRRVPGEPATHSKVLLGPPKDAFFQHSEWVQNPDMCMGVSIIPLDHPVTT